MEKWHLATYYCSQLITDYNIIINLLRLLQTFVGLLLPKLFFFDHIKANYLNLHFPKKLT